MVPRPGLILPGEGRTLQTGSVESRQKFYAQHRVSITISSLKRIVGRRTWNLPNCDMVTSDSSESPAAATYAPRTNRAVELATRDVCLERRVRDEGCDRVGL